MKISPSSPILSKSSHTTVCPQLGLFLTLPAWSGRKAGYLVFQVRIEPLLQLRHAEFFIRRLIYEAVAGLGRNKNLPDGLDHTVGPDPINFGDFDEAVDKE